MVFDIVNTVLLLFVILINYRVLKNLNTLQTKNISKISSSSLADDIMSCDNCDSCENCENCDNRDNHDNYKDNDISVSIKQPVNNIYTDCLDNDKIKLLEINQNNKQREWTEIQIAK
jgi:hypothetical protein